MKVILQNGIVVLPKGLSMSNALFLFSTNYIIDYIHNKYARTHGVYVNNCSFLLQAFADDMVIYGKDIETAQIVLDELNILLGEFGLKLQTKKSYADYLNDENDDNHENIKIKVNGEELPNLSTNPSFKYLGQYVYYKDEEELFNKYAEDLKSQLNNIKNEFSTKIIGATAGDYWYAYRNICRFKVNWFLRINNTTDENRKVIDDVEKEFFATIPGLENKLTDEDYKIRMEKNIASRFNALAKSNDSRILSLYSNSMSEERYEEAKKHSQTYKNDKSLNGFSLNMYSTV
jgi:hypothetical protein